MRNRIQNYTRGRGIRDGVMIPLDEYFARSEFPGILLHGLRQLKARTGKLEIGELSITANAARHLEHVDVLIGLIRHQFGDWGEVDEHDRDENALGLEASGPLFSSHMAQDQTHFWIVTDAGCQATVLLPEETLSRAC